MDVLAFAQENDLAIERIGRGWKCLAFKLYDISRQERKPIAMVAMRRGSMGGSVFIKWNVDDYSVPQARLLAYEIAKLLESGREDLEPPTVQF